MIPLIFAQATQPQAAEFLAPEDLANKFSKELNGEIANYEIRNFPDGETYLRVLNDCLNRDIIILANLHQPNSKFLPLIFLCDVLKEMGCNKISLIAPYLPYMRQDIQFHDGEAVTSRFFAKLISQHVDCLITIDPHLHRYHSLSQIYTCDTLVLQANPVIADWIKNNISKPFIVGPDSESEQWAANIAKMVGCPYLILDKQRLGDKEVKVSTSSTEDYEGLTPILIDDIISTGRTMIETAKWLSDQKLCPPICIGVHALFSGDAQIAMEDANIAKVLTCSTVLHPSNAIDISDLLINAIMTDR